MRRKSNYDKFPIISVRTHGSDCWENWPQILNRLRSEIAEGASVLCVECYPGTYEEELIEVFELGLHAKTVIKTADLLKSSQAIERMVEEVLGVDPVFGRM